MSSKNTSLEHKNAQQSRSVHYDKVYVDSSSPEDADEILNSEPLPPPLPLQPPFGPEFYPSDNEDSTEIPDIKPVRKFIPDSWKNFFRGKRGDPEWNKQVSAISDGIQCSPPSSPTLTPVKADHISTPSSYQDPYGGSGGTYTSQKEAEVCLKLWRHETARRHREFMEERMKSQSFGPKRMYEDHENDMSKVAIKTLKSAEMKPEVLNGYIPAGHIPKPIVMPDYLAKYPAIRTNEERDRYKAVFNDQFSEYKELSSEVQAVLKKFDELDALMRKLPQHIGNTLEHDRIANVLQQYKKKKNDPTFQEKKERCEYLKNKLSHIKQRIQEYDKIMNWNT